ncbi:hypothetical protein LTR85_007668 [Meristemomyces frigidus]|nr:hypothetical protein LTR85_007668 [Meristemomyces frigidus]
MSFARRNDAAGILQSYEELSWYSFQRCESITQTRLHFQNIVAGFTSEDEAEFVDWKEDKSPHSPKPGEEVKASRKGKERASLGGGHGVAGPSSPRGSKGKAAEQGGGSGGSSAAQTKKKRKSAGGENRS